MSELIPSSTTVCEKAAVKDKSEIESMFAKLFEESEKKSSHHDDEKEKMRRRHILEELQLDLERILKQRIDFDEGIELPTFDESYHTFETLAKKTTESMKTLASIVELLISGYLSGSVEGVNIALGLNKLFQQALENYKVYMRRFETLIDRQMQNRKAYRNGLVDLHAAYVQESTELAKQRDKSFDELVEKAKEIMNHNAFDVLKQNYNEMMKVMTFIK